MLLIFFPKKKVVNLKLKATASDGRMAKPKLNYKNSFHKLLGLGLGLGLARLQIRSCSFSSRFGQGGRFKNTLRVNSLPNLKCSPCSAQSMTSSIKPFICCVSSFFSVSVVYKLPNSLLNLLRSTVKYSKLWKADFVTSWVIKESSLGLASMSWIES